MIIGEYWQKVGNKKRIAIPSELRKELGSRLYITRGYESSLVIVGQKQWDSLISEVKSGSIINNLVRDTARILVGSAKVFVPDAQGRFVVPDGLFEYAQMTQKVVFVGLINWVEIWSEENWNKRLKYLEKNGSEIAQKLAEFKGGNI